VRKAGKKVTLSLLLFRRKRKRFFKRHSDETAVGSIYFGWVKFQNNAKNIILPVLFNCKMPGKKKK